MMAALTKLLEEITKYKNEKDIIINHKMNRGLGETIRDLFEKFNEIATKDDFLIRLDCDNTMIQE